MMMMIIINRQPVIKWCLTGRSALWDSSERRHARPFDQYELHLGERVQALCPSMHWEGGREISESPENSIPRQPILLVSKRVKLSSVFVHAVVPLRKTAEKVPASSNLSCVFI